MPHLSGYLGLGRLVNGAFEELDDYTRPAFHAVDDPTIGRIERFPAPAGPVGVAISHGALYDTPTGPRALFH
jgi:hypothetical protein